MQGNFTKLHVLLLFLALGQFCEASKDEMLERCLARIKEGEFTNSSMTEVDTSPGTKAGDYYDGDYDYNGEFSQVRIILILDATGSMKRFSKDVIEKVNEIIETQKTLVEGDLQPSFTLVRFAQFLKVSEYDSVQGVELLDEESYECRGKTALYDAIGCT